MANPKRIFIATICGFLFGLICMFLATSNPDSTMSLSTATKLNIVISRTLLGFMIGISILQIKWWLHGVLLGFIASIPMAVAVMDRTDIFIGTFVMGMIYGLLTELITSVVFKAKTIPGKSG